MEETDYIEEEELMWSYGSEKGEVSAESNTENYSRLSEEESFKRETSELQEEWICEEDGENLRSQEMEEGYESTSDDISDVSQAWTEDKFEYPGEFNDEDDKSFAIPPAPALASRSSKVQDEAPVDRLKIIPMKPNPCIRDRMRKWLNRDHNQLPTESFLGAQYSTERIRNVDRLDDPCLNLYFKRFGRPEIQDDSKMARIDSDKTLRRRRMCACHGKIDETSTQLTKEMKSMTSDIKDPSSGASSAEDRKRIPCTCGDSEECLGWRPVVPEEPKMDSPREFEECKEESSSKDQGKKPETCACDTKYGKDKVGEEDTLMREKLHHLMKVWFELKQRVCHCRKIGWMAVRIWERRKRQTRCICKKLERKRGKLKRMMKEIRSDLLDRRIQEEETIIKKEKINQLYRMVGPTLAAEYKELSEKHPPPPRWESNSFSKMIMKEFGGQLRKYRMQNLKDGSIHREHRRGDYDSLQYVELPNGSIYYGQFSRLGMEGKCIYKMAHGPVYVGSMVDGKMEGKGQLIYPNGGIVEGTWVNGTLFDPKYTFSDGLKFQPYNWKYCRMPDRRFVSEMVNGMNSPDNVQLSADHPARQIPKGCLDAGEGFYDPQKRVIIHPSTGKTIRIVGEQEGNWILQNCRREWFEEVPFSRYMYENWYAGTVFPPPGDEPEWFDKEFAKVLLPYTNVADVIQARRLAMDAASKPSPGPGEVGYASNPQNLPTLTLNCEG